MFWFAVDLSELPSLDQNVKWFGYNRRALVAIHDEDYGGDLLGSLKDKVTTRLQNAKLDHAATQIVLLTIPRVAGYVFNPVSFYLCFDQMGALAALVAEVRNTFGEMHHYLATPESTDSGESSVRFQLPKSFYVSPFLDTTGSYDLSVNYTPSALDLRIDLRANGTLRFSATMRGRGSELTSRTLLKTLLRYPLFAATIMMRIKWQAFRLYCIKRLPMFDKPDPSHPETTRTDRRGLWVRWREAFVRHSRRGTVFSTQSQSPSTRDAQ